MTLTLDLQSYFSMSTPWLIDVDSPRSKRREGESIISDRGCRVGSILYERCNSLRTKIEWWYGFVLASRPIHRLIAVLFISVSFYWFLALRTQLNSKYKDCPLCDRVYWSSRCTVCSEMRIYMAYCFLAHFPETFMIDLNKNSKYSRGKAD